MGGAAGGADVLGVGTVIADGVRSGRLMTSDGACRVDEADQMAVPKVRTTNKLTMAQELHRRMTKAIVSVEKLGVGAQFGSHGRLPEAEESFAVTVGHEVEERSRQR